MKVDWSPNVGAVLRADPVLAIGVEALRKDARGGDLYLARSDAKAPFSARYTAPDRTQRRVESHDLISAILAAVEPEVTW